MSTTKAKSSKPTACTSCTGTALVRRITTFPIRLNSPPSLAGKEIHVGRVALYECQSCGNLMPTPAGQAKVDRCVATSMQLFLGMLTPD
jgi:ribosomal protein L37AE/L43A